MQKFCTFLHKNSFSSKIGRFYARKVKKKRPTKYILAQRGDSIKTGLLHLVVHLIIEKAEAMYICPGSNQHICHLIVF